MSKVKSAIITSIVVIAIIVAAFFGTVSFRISDTQRYNSIAASISMGSDFTGYATKTMYPEGVVSSDKYSYMSDEDKTGYEKQGAVYVNLEEAGYDSVAQLSAEVSADAEVLAQRFADRGLSDFSVSVQDGITIKVSVPTQYSYAAYVGNDSVSQSQRLQVAGLLIKGFSYPQIVQATGASTATISRVKKFVEYGTDGYRDVLRKLESKAVEEEAPKKKSVKK